MTDRWGAIVIMIVAVALTSLFTHESISTAQTGLTFFIYVIPGLSLAFVIWAVASRHLSDRPRRLTMVLTILLACGVWILVRTEGMTSDIGHEFAWRWAEIPEENLLSQTDDELTGTTSAMIETDSEAEWPGFRGPDRNSIIHGIQISTDWSTTPPVVLWRQAVGPGLGSFAVHGDLLFTQEQRGEEETVSCYSVSTGKPIWRHRDTARFFGADANPGPRATPTLRDGKVYALGATGILNALKAGDGSVIWSRNVVTDINEEVPIWGFSSSPLVVQDIVVIHIDSSLVAYDLVSGDKRWVKPVGSGYSSPHLLTIDGVEQIILLSGSGVTSCSLNEGAILWEYSWPEEERILQPALTSNGDLLISTVLKSLRRLKVSNGSDGWTTEELWTSTRLKSNFYDFIVHKGHAYGFTGPILTCIDLKDGTRTWRGGRYGGQLLLLADQDLILVLSEKGNLALASTAPDQFKELADFQAIEGKTWNHPVLVGDILLVRNNQEMAAFRLPLEGG